jgi:hypothetical protein
MACLASRLGGCSVFSKMDLRKGYLQVPVATQDIAKTAIISFPSVSHRQASYRLSWAYYNFTDGLFRLHPSWHTQQQSQGCTAKPLECSSDASAAFQAAKQALSILAVLDPSGCRDQALSVHRWFCHPRRSSSPAAAPWSRLAALGFSQHSWTRHKSTKVNFSDSSRQLFANVSAISALCWREDIWLFLLITNHWGKLSLSVRFMDSTSTGPPVLYVRRVHPHYPSHCRPVQHRG